MQNVIVIGAGPTGLAAACGLRGAGVAVRVLDGAAGPAVTSRALGLQPRGVEVLHRLGALADLPERAMPIDKVVMTVNGRELVRLWVGAAMRRLGVQPGLIISQAEIERAMRDRLAELGGKVEWGRRVAGLAVRRDRVSVRLEDGGELDAGWVIGADGAHSIVRKALDVGFPGVPLVERFLLADVHADLNRPRDAACTWITGDNLLAAFPLPGDGLWRLMAPAPAGFGDKPTHDAIVEFLGTRLKAEVVGSIRTAEWTSSFRIQRRLADTYRRGRVLLAGDAAHIHSPLGGQGMNTGIGDAENLAWKLALVIGGRAADGLLDTYETERRPIAKEVLDSTTGLTRLVVSDNPLAQFVRDRIALPLLSRAWTQRLVATRASQLRVTYRGGPLGAGSRRLLPGPQPGDRVPDRDGMYDALGPAWALIGPESLAEVARERLAEVVTLGGHGDALLVRPDGHLAWRGSDVAALRSWLDGALGQRAEVHAR